MLTNPTVVKIPEIFFFFFKYWFYLTVYFVVVSVFVCFVVVAGFNIQYEWVRCLGSGRW